MYAYCILEQHNASEMGIPVEWQAKAVNETDKLLKSLSKRYNMSSRTLWNL